MAAATALTVSRESAIKLFKELGVKVADTWPKQRMLDKIAKLPEVPKEDRETETDESEKLLESLLAALKDETAIEVTGFEDDGKAKPDAKKEKAAKAKDDDGDKPKKEKKAKKEKEDKGPGVIASIVEFLSKATEKKPLTKEDIVNKLAERFPDRKKEAMEKTVQVQVPNRIKVDKKLNVQKVDKTDKSPGGYWIKAAE